MAAIAAKEPEQLAIALEVVYRLLIAKKDEDGGGFRIALFGPGENGGQRVPENARQLTDYCGHGGGGRGRKMSCRLGVVGLAFRDGLAHYCRIAEESDIKPFLVREYGYTHEEAAQMNQSRRAYAAVPIGVAGKVVAVLYADSSDPDFFGAEESEERRIIETSIAALAAFIVNDSG